jgi:hypothetical protein
LSISATVPSATRFPRYQKLTGTYPICRGYIKEMEGAANIEEGPISNQPIMNKISKKLNSTCNDKIQHTTKEITFKLLSKSSNSAFKHN